jgi:hypothetical protein
LVLKQKDTLDMMPNTLKLQIGGMKMNNVSSDYNGGKYVFSFPEKLDITELNNKIKLSYNKK